MNAATKNVLHGKVPSPLFIPKRRSNYNEALFLDDWVYKASNSNCLICINHVIQVSYFLARNLGRQQKVIKWYFCLQL
jgi:hypothetical protein